MFIRFFFFYSFDVIFCHDNCTVVFFKELTGELSITKLVTGCSLLMVGDGLLFNSLKKLQT